MLNATAQEKTPVMTRKAKKLNNRRLAAALRREKKPTSGAAWQEAKVLVTVGFTPRQAAQVLVVS
jgi:hypothetical protein